MKKYLILISIFFSLQFSYSQNDENISQRLRALISKDITFYNIDGYNITSQIWNAEFTEKGLKKPFKKYSVKEEDSKIKDDSLQFNNYYVVKNEKISETLTQNTSYYFVENNNKTITIISFSKVNNSNKKFERNFATLVLNNKIPDECFDSMTIGSINFAGRKIELSSSCYWTNINTVQCPYYGEMNWSVHKELEDAKQSVENQLSVTKSQKGGKVISEEMVDIIFEENEVKAKKVIYDIKGVNSLLAGMSGGKTLTIYYVASPVRGNFVSCVLSFWNNDQINESGLPPLLEKVMKLKK